MKIAAWKMAGARGGTMVLLLGLCSCLAPNPKIEPWRQDGRQLGTIEQYQYPWGIECIYRNNASQAARLERRNDAAHFLPGACITTLAYSTSGDLDVEQSLNANEEPCLNDNGYAVRRYRYNLESETNRVVEESYFGVQQQPVLTRQGFALVRQTQDLNGQPTRIQFYDLAGKPASAVWLEVTNVAEVKFVTLQGVTEVTGAILLDSAGNVVGRKQVSGLTSKSWITWGYP